MLSTLQRPAADPSSTQLRAALGSAATAAVIVRMSLIPLETCIASI